MIMDTGQHITAQTPAAPQPARGPARQPIQFLVAKQFHFQAESTPLRPTRGSAALAKEEIRQERNGSLALTLLPQGQSTKVVLQISQGPATPCGPGVSPPCSAAAPARGTVAELQWSFPSQRLKPGLYRLGRGGSTPETEVITHWRQLVLDPARSQRGCERWGEASLEVKQVTYGANGQLTFLAASLRRTCEPAVVFKASWWCRLALEPGR